MADLKAKAADIADKALARLYFVVGAIIGIFTGVLSAIPHLPQIVEGLWGKAKDAKVAKPTGNPPLRAPLPSKALKVDHGSKENTAPNANGHANGHHSPGEESNVPLSRNASIGGYVHPVLNTA